MHEAQITSTKNAWIEGLFRRPSLSTSFRFRTKYVSFASAAERLKWVKLRYEIRSENSPDDPKNLEDFVNNMEAIVSAELANWQEGLLTGDIAEKRTTSITQKPNGS